MNINHKKVNNDINHAIDKLYIKYDQIIIISLLNSSQNLRKI